MCCPSTLFLLHVYSQSKTCVLCGLSPSLLCSASFPWWERSNMMKAKACWLSWALQKLYYFIALFIFFYFLKKKKQKNHFVSCHVLSSTWVCTHMVHGVFCLGMFVFVAYTWGEFQLRPNQSLCAWFSNNGWIGGFVLGISSSMDPGILSCNLAKLIVNWLLYRYITSWNFECYDNRKFQVKKLITREDHAPIVYPLLFVTFL